VESTRSLTTASLDAVRYDVHTGLVPVVVQDVHQGTVLMLAYANREALKRTFGTGEAWFWSRSRSSFWRKGATSGNVQKVVDVRLDCDGDAVLYLVEPAGPACHTGEETCFYRSVEYAGRPVGAGADNGLYDQVSNEANNAAGDVRVGDGVQVGDGVNHRNQQKSSVDAAEADCEAVQANGLTATNRDPMDASALTRLWDVMNDRWNNRPQGSYTTYLFEHGIDKIGKKVGEESVEVVIAAKNAKLHTSGRDELASESADLLYHLFALWKAAGISPENVFRVLEERSR
jgi:phosphoribosyl-AMP cyclohydrolase / phosphoribosyl-ATP pyrophosphohydrolase